MKVIGYVKNHGHKVVYFEEVLVGTTQTELLREALAHAGETHHSIFNYRVNRGEVGRASVVLYTD